MSNYYNQDEKEGKLEDILQSIKGIIDTHNGVEEDELSGEISKHEEKDSEEDASEEDAILELNEVASSESLNKSYEENQDFLVSSETQRKAASQFQKFSESISNKDLPRNNVEFLENSVNHIMQPLIKEWLDANLPKIVEQVVSEEIKKLIPKS